MKNGDRPANPSNFEANASNDTGLTKREYFAGLAMQGLSSIDWEIKTEPVEDTLAKMVAWQAVKIADALLSELEK